MRTALNTLSASIVILAATGCGVAVPDLVGERDDGRGAAVGGAGSGAGSAIDHESPRGGGAGGDGSECAAERCTPPPSGAGGAGGAAIDAPSGGAGGDAGAAIDDELLGDAGAAIDDELLGDAGATIDDELLGDAGGADGTDEPPETGLGGDAGVTDPEEPECECTDGPCCDGCYYRPPTHQCATDVAYEADCSGGTLLICGVSSRHRITEQIGNIYCSGTSPACDGSVEHTSTQSSECPLATPVCRVRISGSACEAC